MKATDMVTITLEAQQWNTLLEVLHNAPISYRVAAPLIESIGKQTRQFQASAIRPNGEAEEAGHASSFND